MHVDGVTEVFVAAACRGRGTGMRAACAYVVWESGAVVAERGTRIPSRHEGVRLPITRIIAETAALYSLVDTQVIAGKDLLIRTECRFLIGMFAHGHPATFTTKYQRELGIDESIRGPNYLEFLEGLQYLDSMLRMLAYKLAISTDPLTADASARRRMPSQPRDRAEGKFLEARPNSVRLESVRPTRNRRAGRLALAALGTPEDAQFFDGTSFDINFAVIRSER